MKRKMLALLPFHLGLWPEQTEKRKRSNLCWCGFLCLSAIFHMLSGCANNDDPSKGGFIAGVRHISSGVYADREHTLALERDAAAAQQDVLQAEKASLTAEQSRLAEAIAAKRHELSILQNRLAGLRSDVVRRRNNAKNRSYARAIDNADRAAKATLQQPSANDPAELKDLAQTITNMNKLVTEIAAGGADS